MKKLFLLLSILFFVGIYAQSPTWVKFSGPSNYPFPTVYEVSMGTDNLGNIYTAASMRDTVNNLEKSMLVKYDPSGSQQWINYYSFNSTFSNATHAITLLVDNAGNSYLCGFGNHNTTTVEDFMVIKYNSSGVQQWLQYFDGGQSTSDYVTCAAFDFAGNIIIGGYVSNQGTTWDDICVMKISTSGSKLWSYVYNNNAINDDDRVNAVTSDGSGNIFVTGTSYGTDKRDMITIKLNSLGISQWTRTMPHLSPGSDEAGFGLVTDATGNCYVTGVTNEWITIKYDQSGTALWTNHYTTNMLNRSVKKIMLDKNNNLIVTGDVFVGSGNFSDLAAIKLNSATGAQIWATTYNTSGVDGFSDAVIDTSGNVYLCGYYEGPAGIDITMISLSSLGQLSWHQTYTNSSRTDGADRAFKIALDGSRNVIVAGTAERRGANSQEDVDVITLKYSTPITGIPIQSIDDSFFSIYPNPSHDRFTISSNDEKLIGSKICVINSIGEIVISDTLKSEEQTFNLKSLPGGVYFVNITGGKSLVTKKLIVN